MFEESKETKKIGIIVGIYGEGGIGKTSIFGRAICEAEKGIAISVVEDGITPLKNNKVFASLEGINHLTTPIKKWSKTPLERRREVETRGTDQQFVAEDGMMELIPWLMKNKYSDIYFDSLSMIMESLEKYCLQVYYFDAPENHGKTMKTQQELISKAFGFGKSELISYMASEWKRFITAIQAMRAEGTNVYYSVHSATKKGRIAGEELEYDTVGVDMPSTKSYDLGEMIYNVSDLFLYGCKDISVARGNNKKGYAIGTGERILISQSTPVVKAKARVNMPDEIPATWEDLKIFIK